MSPLALTTGNTGIGYDEFLRAPIICAGSLDDGRRWAQLWDAEFRVDGKLPAGPLCMAWMGDGQNFGIEQGCPPAWVDIALGLFDMFRKGGVIVPTHVKQHGFGTVEFTPLVPEPVAVEPTLLDGLEVDA